MDKYEYNTENFNNVDGNIMGSEEITDTLITLSGIDSDLTEELESAVYDLYVTGQNKYNRDSFRLFFKSLAIITDKIQNEEYYRIELSERIETIFGSKFYSADEIAKDILIDPCYVIGRLIDIIEQKGE